MINQFSIWLTPEVKADQDGYCRKYEPLVRHKETTKTQSELDISFY